MNVLELIVIAAGALLAFSGFRKGFVRKLAAMLSLVLSIALVSAFLPYITDFLKEHTPVYSCIVQQCERAVERQASGLLPEKAAAGSADGQEKPLGKLTRIEQTALIDQLPLPKQLKELLLDYNNEEGYQGLRVSGFQDYLVNFIATGILNVAAFLVSVIVVQLLLWAVFTVLNVMANIPVIRMVNRIAGLLLGLLQWLFLAWLFFLILSMFSGTEAGLVLMNMVEQSELLSMLYESNLFLRIVLHAAAIFA